MRAALEARWLTLTRDTMPAIAAERGWPVRFDHCFQRILLDTACGTVWYDRITGRPAYRHASENILSKAVQLGEAAMTGAVNLDALNRDSIAMRRARKTAQGALDLAMSDKTANASSSRPSGTKR